MASVLVKNLPSASSINGTDLVIVNIGEGEEYVTSNMSIAEFKTALNSSGTGNNDLTGDVKVDGSVHITKVGSQFFGDLKGTAETVASLSPFTTADLPSDGINLYFTALDATKLADLRTDVDLKAPNVPSLNSNNFLTQGNTVAELFDQIDVAVATRAPNVAIKNSKNFITDEMTVGQSVDALDAQLGTTANLAATALQSAALDDYIKTDDANGAYAAASSNGNTIDGNATAITDVKATADGNIAGAAAGLTALQPVALDDYSTTAEADDLYAAASASTNTVDGNATAISNNVTAIDGKVTKSVITKILNSSGDATATPEAMSKNIADLQATVDLLIAAMNA